MPFKNLPFDVDPDGHARLRHSGGSPFAHDRSRLDLSERTLADMREMNGVAPGKDDDPAKRIGGSLAFHCSVDREQRRVVEAAARATPYCGYEAILPGRDLRQIGLVSSTAASICGGVHTTASALALEMALGIRPPPLGIVIRNLLLSCQYLNDNPMHLFNIAGPDYSAAVISETNPEIYRRAQSETTRLRDVHGYATLADIMIDLNRPDGKLFRETLAMARRARDAYALLGGRYPHSDSVVPGGVTMRPTMEQLDAFEEKLVPFRDYTRRCVAVWDEVFDFLYRCDDRFAEVGEGPATLVDFGQWDHEEAYDGTYGHCSDWGEKRWSTPGAVVDGKLVTTRLSEINIGLEEFVDRSHYEPWTNHRFKSDPAGNPLGPNHPWNKMTIPGKNDADGERYSYGNSLTWDRHAFEVGAYARVYVSALGRKLPASRYLESTGDSLRFSLPAGELAATDLRWRVPNRWNAIERNRARAYAVALNLAVTLEQCDRARQLLRTGELETCASFAVASSGTELGAGFWGAGRGMIAHWAVVEDGVVTNYQISTPSRINAGPRTPWGAPGPCERALSDTPIIEQLNCNIEDFRGIDIQRAIQSFDLCIPCTTHFRFDHYDQVMNREMATTCSI